MNECILFSKIWINSLYRSIKYTKDNNDNKITQKKKKEKEIIHIANLRYQSITSNCIRNHWKENELGFPILKLKLKFMLVLFYQLFVVILYSSNSLPKEISFLPKSPQLFTQQNWVKKYPAFSPLIFHFAQSQLL